ncbi:MAG: hypothetical protein F6K41_01435 [Symploca sp. SIO3E6]|nr:hypothetical protein [Caldora sp. SIO3E6]
MGEDFAKPNKYLEFYVQNQETYFAGVGHEVILSAGAIASPKMRRAAIPPIP